MNVDEVRIGQMRRFIPGTCRQNTTVLVRDCERLGTLCQVVSHASGEQQSSWQGSVSGHDGSPMYLVRFDDGAQILALETELWPAIFRLTLSDDGKLVNYFKTVNAAGSAEDDIDYEKIEPPSRALELMKMAAPCICEFAFGETIPNSGHPIHNTWEAFSGPDTGVSGNCFAIVRT